MAEQVQGQTLPVLSTPTYTLKFPLGEGLAGLFRSLVVTVHPACIEMWVQDGLVDRVECFKVSCFFGEHLEAPLPRTMEGAIEVCRDALNAQMKDVLAAAGRLRAMPLEALQATITRVMK